MSSKSNYKRLKNKNQLRTSWEDGSSMWVIYGEGIRVFIKEDFESVETLLGTLERFFENTEKYEVYGN